MSEDSAEPTSRGAWQWFCIILGWIWFVIAWTFFWSWYRFFTGGDPEPPNTDKDANSLWD